MYFLNTWFSACLLVTLSYGLSGSGWSCDTHDEHARSDSNGTHHEHARSDSNGTHHEHARSDSNGTKHESNRPNSPIIKKPVTKSEKPKTKTNTYAIGIDLGTTYSCMGVYRGGKVDIIPNVNGHRTTPSVVSLKNKELLVGDVAASERSKNPEYTFYEAKRFMGVKFSDPTVKNAMAQAQYEFTLKRSPEDAVVFQGPEQYFQPEEISGLILKHLKEAAETYLGGRVEAAVITVPAYFSDSQREATKDAAKLAGLEVLRIINEPTAAALAYGLITEDKNEQTILVYDWGGGTFDVSLLAFDGKVFEVLATAGNTHSGGQDLTRKIQEYCLAVFKAQHGGREISAKKMASLFNECEDAKRRLSQAKTTVVDVEAFNGEKDLKVSLSRAKFESLGQGAFESTLSLVSKVLQDANKSKSKVNKVLLIGGTTRIPKVSSMLTDYFGKAPFKSINQDEAVAYGAAVQAAILAPEGSKNYNEAGVKDMLLLDVAPMTLGIETVGGFMTSLIKRNTPIPIKKTKDFFTVVDNQPFMIIKVYEGERPMTKDNNLLGEFTLDGIPPRPIGDAVIEVTFDIDADGILQVSASEKSTGKSNHVTISKGRLSREAIEKMVEEAGKYKEADEAEKLRTESRNTLEGYALEVQKSMDDLTVSLEASEIQSIRTVCSDALKWVFENPKGTTQEYSQKYTELLGFCAPLLTKADEKKAEKLRTESRHTLERYALKVQKSVDDLTDSLQASEIQSIRTACEDALRWVSQNPEGTTQEYSQKYTELSGFCAPLLTKADEKGSSKSTETPSDGRVLV